MLILLNCYQKNYLTRSKACNLIKYYLTDRKQNMSLLSSIKEGVTQGTPSGATTVHY